MNLTFSEIIELINSISITLASVIAIYGIGSWRRETRWKRKYELAEETLALFYDAQERLAIIRSPASYSHEGKTRNKNENENPEESSILDNAYVAFERFEREREPFNKLKVIKFKFIVAFGKEYAKPFDEVRRIISEVLNASNAVFRHQLQEGKRVNQMSQAQLEKYLEKMQAYEDKLWASDSESETDLISARMVEAIEVIEIICNNILKKQNVSLFWQQILVITLILCVGLVLPILIFMFYHGTGWSEIAANIFAGFCLLNFVGLLIMIRNFNRFLKD